MQYSGAWTREIETWILRLGKICGNVRVMELPLMRGINGEEMGIISKQAGWKEVTIISAQPLEVDADLFSEWTTRYRSGSVKTLTLDRFNWQSFRSSAPLSTDGVNSFSFTNTSLPLRSIANFFPSNSKPSSLFISTSEGSSTSEFESFFQIVGPAVVKFGIVFDCFDASGYAPPRLSHFLSCPFPAATTLHISGCSNMTLSSFAALCTNSPHLTEISRAGSDWNFTSEEYDVRESAIGLALESLLKIKSASLGRICNVTGPSLRGLEGMMESKGVEVRWDRYRTASEKALARAFGWDVLGDRR